MAGETFKPKRVLMRGTIKETVGIGALTAGSVDIPEGEEAQMQAASGIFTRRVVCEPPGAWIFECECGHKRRILDSERNFACEAEMVGRPKCDIIWTTKPRGSGEFDDNGDEIMVPEMEKQTITVNDEWTKKPRKVTVEIPIFIGRRKGDVMRASRQAQAASGEGTQFSQPTNTINKLQVQDGSQNLKDHLKPLADVRPDHLKEKRG